MEPQGLSSLTEKEPATPSVEGSNPPPAAPSDPAGSPQSSRPEWLPEQHWDAATNTFGADFGKHYQEMATRDAAAQERQAKVPAAATDYQAVVPEDLQLPEGMSREMVKIDTENPLFKKVQDMAFRAGMSQDDFNEMMGAYVQDKLSSAGAGSEAQKAQMDAYLGDQMKALGPNANTRIAAARKTVEGLKFGKAISEALDFSADQILGLEEIASLITNQGAAAVTPQPNAAQSDPKRIEGYDNMSFEEKVLTQRARRAAAN